MLFLIFLTLWYVFQLKLLHVHVEHPSGDLMKKLFACCPLLEDLTIDGHLYPLDDGQTCNIIVPTLKRLRIFVIVKHRLVSEHKFVIRAPNLEYLSIIVDSLAYFLLNETPFLKEAFVSVGCYVMRQSFGISKDEANRAMELLRAIKNTKILSLPDRTMTALGFVYNENLPTFPNLTHLKLKIESCFGWKLLTPFLNNSPNLEVLILDLCEANKLYHHLLEDIIFEDFDWVEPESVPRCLLSRVKVLKIIYMQGEDQQLEVVKYLLKNSVVLDKFSVGFWGSATNLEKEILMFPRGSKTCSIEFL